MSPLALRRYRAERLLREEFERLRGRVLATVAGRLRGSGVRLDASDLEACYAMAWHGLYTAVLEGQEIANPTGWLVLVTFRRAIEEHRARARIERDSRGVDTVGGVPRAGDRRPPGAPPLGAAHEYDLAAELDDRMRLRQLFEGLRGRLSARELQAAALCYLQGLSRSEAAARMGVSEARMRKLMEGAGPGRPGVAAKVGTLVETIRSGSWCEEQGSLMRGFAFGVLAPDGERYRLALIHNEECPACRAYVLALRGLAAVLPPVPCILHWALGAGAAAGAGAAGGGAATGAAAGPAAHAGAGVGASPGAGASLGGGAAAPAGPAVGEIGRASCRERV
jgi:DNA-directed RNA polymerase specialized sigma24 family protein